MKKSSSKLILGYALAILSGFMYGIVPLITAPITRSGKAGSVMVVFIRCIITTLILIPFALKKKGCGARPMDKPFLKQMLINGLFIALTSGTLFSAYNYTSSAVTIMMHYLHPFFAALIATLLWKKKMGGRTWLALAVVAVGMFLLCDARTMPEGSLPGILLAVSSGLFFAITLTHVEKQQLSAGNPYRFSYLQSLCAAGYFFLYLLVTGGFANTLEAKDWLLLLLFGVLNTVGSVTLYQAIIYIGSVKSSILSTMEPLVTTVGSAIFMHEALSGRSCAGVVLILAAVILVTTAGSGKKEAAEAGKQSI